MIEKKGKLRDAYRIGAKLGDGAFGSVRKITHRLTGESRAVKTIHKKDLRGDEELQSFFNEVSALRVCDHPNILKLYEFYQDEKNYYLITELCTGGEIFEKIISQGSFSESVAASYMKQILSVVAYCHERNIVHRDLKPENFLLDNPSENANLKVIDFGTSQFFTRGVLMTAKLGTPYYIAPEVLKRSYDEKCDVWSAGVSMYVLLCGYPPFGGSNDEQILHKISEGRFYFPSPEWDSITAEAKDLISHMLAYDPARRFSAREALAHPWIHNASTEPLDSQLAKSLIENMHNYRCDQKLKKATYAFIATQLATKSEKEEMLSLFKSLDTDSSGTLSRQELVEGFLRISDEDSEHVEAEVDRIMAQVDIDGSGEIDYSEFVAASLSKSKMLSKERLEAAFRTFDIDGSGSISADELKAILGKHHNYDNSLWSDIIREVDQNGDGEIDLREFTEMMLKFNN